jgi:hypothetical protein
MISLLKKNTKNSPVWNDTLKVRNVYIKGRSMIVGDGKSTSFWHDRWCGCVSLADKFLGLIWDKWWTRLFGGIWRRKTGIPLSKDGYMRTCRTKWEGCMTLSTVSVLTTVKIGLSGTGRSLVSSLLSLLTSTWVDLMLVLALRKFRMPKFLWKSEFSCG